TGGGQRGVAAKRDRIAVGLRSRGGDATSIKSRAAGGVSAQAAQGRAAPHGAPEGGSASGVHRQTEGAVDGAGETDGAAARRAQCRVAAQGDRVVVALRPGGADRASVES